MPLPQLRRVRWAVRATLTLGVAASVAANILHAKPNPVSQVIAAWPPLALLLTVELISRIPVHRRSLAAVRLIATSTIAGIAAWVSYWHMVGVAAHYGETGPSPYLLPLSVDGLVIVASVSLVELAGRIRAIEATVVKPALVEAAVEPTPVEAAAVEASTVDAAPAPATGAVAPATATESPASPADGEPKRSPARRTSQPRAAKAAPAKSAPRKRATAKATPAKATPAETTPAETTPAMAPAPVSRNLPPAELVKLAERMKAERPNLTQAAIAAELGITTQRLQQVKRQAIAA